jgi:ATP-dependent Clp protease ATP-binding subunit ClpB
MPYLQNAVKQAKAERGSLESSLEGQRKRLDEIHELKQDLEQMRRLQQKSSLEQQQITAQLQARIAQLEAVPSGDALVTETVGPEEIAEVVSRWTGIPVTRLNQTEKERILQLTDRLKAGVVGQEGPVTAIANAILRSRAGLGNENRPVGSFLLLGPTGDVLCSSLLPPLCFVRVLT